MQQNLPSVRSVHNPYAFNEAQDLIWPENIWDTWAPVMSVQEAEPDPLPLPEPEFCVVGARVLELLHDLQHILRASLSEQAPAALAAAQFFKPPSLALNTWAGELSVQAELLLDVDRDGARVLLDLDRDGDRVPFDVLFLHVPHDEGQFCFTSVV